MPEITDLETDYKRMMSDEHYTIKYAIVKHYLCLHHSSIANVACIKGNLSEARVRVIRAKTKLYSIRLMSGTARQQDEAHYAYMQEQQNMDWLEKELESAQKTAITRAVYHGVIRKAIESYA